MPYSKPSDAPQWVQDLGDKAARQWIAVFNGEFSANGDEARAFAAAAAAVRSKKKGLYVPINKIDEQRRMVWGYASTDELDSQGDRISIEALKAALPGYMKYGNVREMHQPSAVGKAVSAFVDDTGLYVGAHVVDESAWKKVQNEVYNGFSVGGNETARKDEWITGLDLIEISLVDRPANPSAVFDVWKVSSEPRGGVTMNLKKYGGPETGTEDDVIKILDGNASSLEKANADKNALLAKNASVEKQLADMKAASADTIGLQLKVETLEREKTEREDKDRAAACKKLIDGAIAAGKIEAAKRADWETIFKTTGEAVTTRTLNSMPVVVPVGKRVGVGADGVEKGVIELFEDAAAQISRDEKVSIDRAYDLAARRNPKLFEKRNREQLRLAKREEEPIEE